MIWRRGWPESRWGNEEVKEGGGEGEVRAVRASMGLRRD